MSDTPRLVDLYRAGCDLQRELNAAKAEIQSLKHNYNRVIGMYTAKDNQICNLLNICRANGIDVSSQDLINGKEAKL